MKKVKVEPGMIARAMAKAAHEDEMLDGLDPLVDPFEEHNKFRETLRERCQPFQAPEFVLPAPIKIHMSLRHEIDGILGVKVS